MIIDNPHQDANARITPAKYTAEEVASQFQALYDSMDYGAEVAGLGFGALQWDRKKKALREFKALSVALWGVALRRSFPQDAEAFFTYFLENTPVFAGKDGSVLRTRVNIYVDMLRAKQETDFMPVAAYFAEVLGMTAQDAKALSLRVSLILRNVYTLIFERLV